MEGIYCYFELKLDIFVSYMFVNKANMFVSKGVLCLLFCTVYTDRFFQLVGNLLFYFKNKDKVSCSPTGFFDCLCFLLVGGCEIFFIVLESCSKQIERCIHCKMHSEYVILFSPLVN